MSFVSRDKPISLVILVRINVLVVCLLFGIVVTVKVVLFLVSVQQLLYTVAAMDKMCLGFPTKCSNQTRNKGTRIKCFEQIVKVINFDPDLVYLRIIRYVESIPPNSIEILSGLFLVRNDFFDLKCRRIN